MGHNASKVLMGTTGSSVKEVSNMKGVVAAGIATRLKSDGTLVTASANGSLLGISLGEDLSDIGFTAICRKGLRVPLKLKDGFNPTVGAIVEIDDVSGLGTGDGSKTAVNAVYATGRIGSLQTGGIAERAVSEAGTVGVAYIDFPGGL